MSFIWWIREHMAGRVFTCCRLQSLFLRGETWNIWKSLSE